MCRTPFSCIFCLPVTTDSSMGSWVAALPSSLDSWVQALLLFWVPTMAISFLGGLVYFLVSVVLVS